MLPSMHSRLRKDCGLVDDRLVIVGVSGGADSLCLMQVFRQAGLPITVAHFDHRLRSDSGEDARSVQAIANRLSVPFIVGEGDVRAHAGRHGLSIEEAARNLRYEFLFEIARQNGAQAVAVGHTADDQVETVLMHFLRGTGLSGLTGMAFRTIIAAFDAGIPLVRPLLDTWRSETRAFCEANDLAPLFDPSNDSSDFARNRIRHQLIPELQEHNPGFREAVWRMAKSLGRDHELLAGLVKASWDQCATPLTSGDVALDAAQMRDFSPGLRQNILRYAVRLLDPKQELDFTALARASDFIESPPDVASVDLKGGLKLHRGGANFVLGRAAPDPASMGLPQLPRGVDSISVSVPGQTDLGGAWLLIAEPHVARDDVHLAGANAFEASLDPMVLPAALELRCRRPGDRFQPLGLTSGTQKLSDFMVNEKVPARARAHWPLLCSGEVVIWVPGYRLAHPFRITPASKSSIHLRLQRTAAE